MKSKKIFWKYLNSGINKIPGWFSRCDAQIFGILLSLQVDNQIQGSVVEIGIFHGKTFIPLALSNQGDKCYGIDVFDKQELNVDHFGEKISQNKHKFIWKNIKEKFFSNLQRYSIDKNHIVLNTKLSSDIKPNDIIESVGPARFFHIDGGHNFDVVKNDLALANEVISKDGIIALDDIYRSQWPDVSAGLFAYLFSSKPDLVPFAIGFNKLYLCKSGKKDFYQSALLNDDFLRIFFNVIYNSWSGDIAVFQEYLLPEYSIKDRINYYLKIYHPNFYYWQQKIRGRKNKIEKLG